MGGRGRPRRVEVDGGAVTVAAARAPGLREEVVIGIARSRGC